MRSKLLIVVLLAAALCADAQKIRRKHRRLRTTTTEAPRVEAEPARPVAVLGGESDENGGETPPDHEQLAAIERDDEKRYQQAEQERLNEILSHSNGDGSDVFMDGKNIVTDPCLKVHCSAGRVCEIDENGEAVCNCIKECPYETDHRRKVCTLHNETWSSDCEVYRQRCLCLDGSDLCRGPQYHHVQIDYYGECRQMPVCGEDEMADFPRRMRDWLFNIMRDLAARHELSPHYLGMEREAESNLTRRWTNAAIWKWCDLDAHDNDRAVSRHELFPIRAPLVSLEHCIAPFLDRCDSDNDHRITLAEWGTCLELDEFEMEERCDAFTEAVL